MIKTITIDGKEVSFKASAAIPRLYRLEFKRDIFHDLTILEKGMKKNDVASLEVFENVAYIMAKHANKEIPLIEEWLEGFNTFSIYQVLPELIDLWQANTLSLAQPKKK